MEQKFSKARQLGADRAGKTVKRRGRSMTPRQARQWLMGKMLETWSLVVRRRDQVCNWCGTRSRGQAHHIVARSRANNVGHTHVDNGMRLCYDCHMHRIHIEPDEYIAIRDKFLRSKGLSYEILLQRFCTPSPKMTLQDLQAVHERLKRMLTQ